MLFRQNLDSDHPASMADGAFPQRMARESLVSIAIVLRCRSDRRTFTRSGHAEKLAAMLQLFLAVAIAEEPVVADAVEPAR